MTINVSEGFALQSYKKHYLKAIDYQKNGQYEEAIEAFYKAIELKNTEKKKESKEKGNLGNQYW